MEKLEREGVIKESEGFRFGQRRGTCEKLQIFSGNFLRLERGEQSQDLVLVKDDGDLRLRFSAWPLRDENRNNLLAHSKSF